MTTVPLVRFADLRAAGCALAAELETYGVDPRALVLGIVRGGVPAAFEVAVALDLPLDIVLIRPLVKHTSGVLSRAARIAGTLVVDDHYSLRDPVERAFVDEALSALAARDIACRGTRAAARIAERTVLLIDNGMRTGQTMATAIRAVRTLGPSLIVAAAPAGTASAVELVTTLADKLLCLMTSAKLGNVAMAYRRFDVPDEARIRDLLDGV